MHENHEPESYQSLLSELNYLLASIENDDANVDEISARLDMAYKLLEKLKARLTSAEARVEEVINARMGLTSPSDKGTD